MPLHTSFRARLLALQRLPVRIWSVALLAVAAALLIPNSLLAQGEQPSSAIDQSRLYPRTIPPSTTAASGQTVSGPQVEIVTSDDESFGAQQILKEEEKVPEFLLSASSSIYYTSNVALTHADTQGEAFYVGDVGFSWTPRVSPQVQFQFGGALALFRYETSALDFESLGVGTGIIWTPPHAWGLQFITRYDFIELLDHHGREILQDHEFSIAIQKLLILGRSHYLSFGYIGSGGISDPVEEQRDQAGFAIGYHLQIARQFGADVGYRHSWYFYNRAGRTDLNQVWSLGLHYNFNPWISLNGYVSGATNWSDKEVFKYDVFSGGGGLGLVVRF